MGGREREEGRDGERREGWGWDNKWEGEEGRGGGGREGEGYVKPMVFVTFHFKGFYTANCYCCVQSVSLQIQVEVENEPATLERSPVSTHTGRTCNIK